MVGLLVVPIQMSLIPIFKLFVWLHINNTFLGVWLAHTAFGLPLAVFLLYNFISQLPSDLFETASLGGATPLPDVHSHRPAVVVAGVGGIRHLPVPVGLE